ncbi:hypothetical protein DAEQUDRAFT_769220 [Daedalea quercina L-15889]|uniref:Uncharacterized protein n=1 Tax=Daedalea quercina L-15889 TaxID=1314783 RepID=A0A165LXQ4_9APHY|nr:hypothetical protein DAEQUDRAFT_769220 [Daedalea quercina L-15889]
MQQANAGNNNANNAGAKHPNGRAKIAIKDVQRVHGHVEEIPLQAYREANVNVNRGWNTLVTADEVRDASDAYDARGILHDIDTQWGMLPHGGAYKESNHYFGPGEYDFY